MKIYSWFLLAIIGGLTALGAILYGEMPPPVAHPISTPKLPFTHFIYGVGVVEPQSADLKINAPSHGIIRQVFVKPGDPVAKGDPLFKLDDRKILAQLQVANQTIHLKQQALLTVQHQALLLEKLNQQMPEAVSKKYLLKSQDAEKEAQAELALAQAQKQALLTELSLTRITAPIDGQVLSINCHKGQNSSSCLQQGVLVLGSQALNLRVNIDEYDASNFNPKGAAIAEAQGHSQLKLPLTFLYIEPQLKPKTVLTGSPTERTDTRVLQVLYQLPSHTFPLYAGQQMDVYIQRAQ